MSAEARGQNEKTGPNGAATPQPGPASDPNRLINGRTSTIMSDQPQSVSPFEEPHIVYDAEPAQFLLGGQHVIVGSGTVKGTQIDAAELIIGEYRCFARPQEFADLGAALLCLDPAERSIPSAAANAVTASEILDALRQLVSTGVARDVNEAFTVVTTRLSEGEPVLDSTDHIPALRATESTGTRKPTVVVDDSGVTTYERQSYPCAGCQNLTVEGDLITKHRKTWWHLTCAQADVKAGDPREAWLSLGHDLARSPGSYGVKDTRGIVGALLGIIREQDSTLSMFRGEDTYDEAGI